MARHTTSFQNCIESPCLFNKSLLMHKGKEIKGIQIGERWLKLKMAKQRKQYKDERLKEVGGEEG